MSTPEPTCCGPTHNPICPIGSVTTATLPFKLRHKAKNNSADSDSGSDICGNVLTDITANHSVINNSNTNNNAVNFNENNGSNNNANSPNTSALNDSLLKSENYALRSELQRLATEVASLKNVLVFNPTQPPANSLSSNDNLHCNSYQRDSPPESPNLKSDTNDSIIGSNITSNETQSH
jgi:hypothetical protein